jgi:hypothetical protein
MVGRLNLFLTYEAGVWLSGRKTSHVLVRWKKIVG